MKVPKVGMKLRDVDFNGAQYTVDSSAKGTFTPTRINNSAQREKNNCINWRAFNL